MLQHEQQNTDRSVPAAQVRVTAEEFARAVAQCQARREEAARHLEGTVTIGEVVQELGLDITPEDILREVQATRAQQVPSVRKRSGRGVAWISGALLVFLFGGLLASRAPLSVPAADTPATVASVISAETVAAPRATLVQDNHGPQPVLRTLAEIPNDVPFRCALSQTSDSVSLANFSTPENSWTLIKHEGHVYVRGWIANMSLEAMKANGVDIHNHKTGVNTGVAPIPITVRLDRFLCTPGLSTDETISAKNVSPDEHFREKWQRV